MLAKGPCLVNAARPVDFARAGDYSERMPGFGELLIILFIVLLVFGGSKIPGIAKSLGEGIREFKKASRDDDPKSGTK